MADRGRHARRRRGSGAVFGLVFGLAFACAEALGRYAEARAGTDLAFDPWLPLTSALVYAVPSALLGSARLALAPLPLVALSLTGGAPLADVPYLVTAAGVAWAAARVPRVAAAGAAIGLAGALGLAVRAAPEAAAVGDETRPDVLLVVLDTVGAGATSLHGAPLETTPTLRSLAAEGAWFRRAVAPAPWTVPSHAALFTGRTPREVGAHHESPSLAEGAATLAERFGAAGYRTGAFVANPWVGRFNGLTRGFEHQVLLWEIGRAARAFLALRLLARLAPEAQDKGARLLVERALAWWKPGRSGPSFVFLNLLEAHSPFHRVPEAGRFGVADPAEVGERTHRVQMEGPRALPDYPRPGEIEEARRLHAAGIRYLDACVAALLDRLREAGNLDRTVVAITSDHGEAFGEHGFHGHMIGLHPQTLHVPLVLRHPPTVAAGTVVDGSVALIDLHDTLLALAGVPGFEPRLLTAAGAAVVSEQRRPLQVIADFGDRGGLPERLDARGLRVRRGDLALLREEPAAGGPPRWTLYDLSVDPAEEHALVPDARAVPLRRILEDFARRPVAGGEAPRPDADLRARLRALGYLGGS